MGLAVVRVDLGLGRNGQCQLLYRQVGLVVRDVVVRRHILVALLDHGSARDNLVRVRALVDLAACQSDACQRVARSQCAHRHVGVEACIICACRALGLAVIRVGLGLGRDGQRSLVNGQFTIIIYNSIVVRHIRAAVLDNRGTRDYRVGIYALVGLVAVQFDTCQRIIALQALDAHFRGDNSCVTIGRVVLALGTTVVSVGLVHCRNGEFRLADGQLAILVGDGVVARSRADSSIARLDLQLIHTLVRFLTVQFDACQGVIALQTFNRHLCRNVACGGVSRVVLALGHAVVGIALVYGRDGQGYLVDDKVCLGVGNRVVARFRANLGRTRFYLVRVGALIDLASAQFNTCQRIAALQTCHRHIVVKVTCMRACRSLGLAIVIISLRLGGNRQSGSIHRQGIFASLSLVIRGGGPHLHLDSARIRAAGYRRGPIRTIVNRILDGSRRACQQATHRGFRLQGDSIVCLGGLLRRGYCQHHFVIGNCQMAIDNCNIVTVALHLLIDHRVGDSDITRGNTGSTLTRSKLFTSKLHIADDIVCGKRSGWIDRIGGSFQGGAVVRLLRIGHNKLQIALVDDEFGILIGGHRIVVGYITGSVVTSNGDAANCHRLFTAGSTLIAQSGIGHIAFRYVSVFRNGGRIRRLVVSRAVVSHRDGIGGHRHLALLHRQGSRGRGETVVLGFQCVHNRRDSVLADIGVLVTLAGIGNGVQSSRDHTLVLAVLIAGDRVGKRVFVAVRTGLVLGFYRQFGWRHNQLAVNRVYVIVVRICAGFQRIVEFIGVCAHIRSGADCESLVGVCRTFLAHKLASGY